MRISELAERVRVPTSTVRYYERIGLLPPPARTSAGYRDYDDTAASFLLFVHRARTIGLSCDQIADLLPVWGGADCSAAQQRVGELIDQKQAEIAERISELQAFSAQLHDARTTLDASPSLTPCLPDLSCCVPSDRVQLVQLDPIRTRVSVPAVR